MTKQEDKRFTELLDRFGDLSPEEDRELHALSEKNLQEIYNSIDHNLRGDHA